MWISGYDILWASHQNRIKNSILEGFATDRPTDHLMTDSLVSNGSGGGTAAAAQRRVRECTGCRFGGSWWEGTPAAAQRQVREGQSCSGCLKNHSIYHNLCCLGGGQFWLGLGPKLFHTTHNKIFCPDKNSIGLRPDLNSACQKNIQTKIRKYDIVS